MDFNRNLYLCCGVLGGVLWGGRLGVACYICLGTVVANIQVLKVSDLGSNVQLAGGTVVFCSLFWAHDWVTEIFGSKKALQTMWLSFAGLLLVMAWMSISRAMPLVDFPENWFVQDAMDRLFGPSFRLFTASLLAYFVSQLMDILIFERLKKATQGRFLWFRSALSSLVATFIDHLLFSWLAFRVLAEVPLPLDLWVSVYVLKGYVLRVILALLSPLVVSLGVRLWQYKKRLTSLKTTES